MAMRKPLPAWSGMGLGEKAAHSPLRTAIIFTTERKVMTLSAHAKAGPGAKSMRFWPGPLMCWEYWGSMPMASKVRQMSRRTSSPRSSGASSRKPALSKGMSVGSPSSSVRNK